MALYSHIVVPNPFKHFSAAATRSLPCHLSVAISLIPSKLSYIDSLSLCQLFVSKSALSTEESVSELTQVFIPIAKPCFAMSIQLAPLKEASFSSIALEYVIVFVCEFALKGLIVLEGAHKGTALPKGKAASAHTLAVMPSALVNVAIEVAVLAVSAIAHALHVHAAFE